MFCQTFTEDLGRGCLSSFQSGSRVKKKKKLKKVCGNDHEQNEVLLPMASMASGAEVFLLHLMLSNGLKTSVLLQIKLPVMTPSGWLAALLLLQKYVLEKALEERCVTTFITTSAIDSNRLSAAVQVWRTGGGRRPTCWGCVIDAELLMGDRQLQQSGLD